MLILLLAGFANSGTITVTDSLNLTADTFTNSGGVLNADTFEGYEKFHSMWLVILIMELSLLILTISKWAVDFSYTTQP